MQHFYHFVHLICKTCQKSHIERGGVMTNVEWALVSSAKQGDAHAFALLYERFYKDLYRFALCYLKNPDQAEDAVSQAVLTAYEKLPNLKKDSSFKSWIFRITANACRQLFRNDRGVPLSDDYESPVVEEGYEKKELDDLLKVLNDDERMIITLSVFSGYNSSEIADMLIMQPGTVRSIKSRSIAKLREALA